MKNKQHNIRNRRNTMRLYGYDYSLTGMYFLTIVVQNRLQLFGYVRNGIMVLNHAGLMVENRYWEIEHKFPDKRCHAMVVMPNHFHCIIENMEPCAKKSHENLWDVLHSDKNEWDAHVGAPLQRERLENEFTTNTKYGIDNIKYGASIGNVMDWFKTMTTNEYIRGVKNENWIPFDKKLWQRNYYDHIIRNNRSFQKITDYILNNPVEWHLDEFFTN